jgi:CHRD domain
MKQFQKWLVVSSFGALGAVLLWACAPAPSAAPVAGSKSAIMGSLNTFANGAPSTAIGQATLVPSSDGKTKVVVTVTGLTATTKHIGHIHTGSCATPGPVALPLEELGSDGNGAGSVSSTVETAKIPAAAYVQYHQRGKGDPAGAGAGIVCGDIK